ncbi:hypothetical protein F4803DRAFT_577847 [Xylaria telfairii]|nr:hypothetical protein F4803DRAFT_577847 [Xylaria telfairii]
MLKDPSVYFYWITFATMIGATPENTDAINRDDAAIRLAEIQQCPVSPKPLCSDDSCQGSIFVGTAQFLCSNGTPFTAPDGLSVILAGCRCCPLPIEVWCHDGHCGAPEDTRVCVADELRDCVCMTGKDRLAAAEAAAEEDYVWRSDDSVDLDLEPSSEDEEATPIATSSGQRAAMATMEAPQRWLLQDMWGMNK